jgi:hypothetical protein
MPITIPLAMPLTMPLTTPLAIALLIAAPLTIIVVDTAIADLNIIVKV